MNATDGPSYISSHSADVILSDIRPIKLKLEALQSINVLLDEFLYSILSAAQSLATDSLRAGLLKLLPTNLGKEALLEAEVELRAYWDRTNHSASSSSLKGGDEGQVHFHLQWAFELLRLKCEAYSTLNESDEDPGAEGYLQQRMADAGDLPPPTSELAPAALYLTAIIESMCEHILTSVGAVCSRDSSRNNATVQDLFVGLCEDDSIFSLFKSMKVYNQIEQLSQLSKPRRSKSVSSRDRQQQRISSTPTHSQTSLRDPATLARSASQMSYDSPPTSYKVLSPSTSINNGSRSSLDKARVKKLFMPNSRSSIERDVDTSHKRSESVLSEDTQQTWAAFNQIASGDEDNSILQDFDDLMRSSATMKVSLTPDRLKTMEVYKQERGNRQAPPKFDPDSSSSSLPPSSRSSARRPSLLHEDSILEDEEPSYPPPVVIPNPLPGNKAVPSLPSTHRNRSESIASTTSTVLSKALTAPTPPTPTSMAHKTQRRGGPHNNFDNDPFPVKTRRIQKNRESLDLDAVMAGSDDDDAEQPTPPPPPPPQQSGSAVRHHQQSQSSSAPRSQRRPAGHTVSAGTKDLMDFLAEGPPEPPISKSGNDMMDFLAQGPPDDGLPPSTPINMQGGSVKAKGSGRLQRMISKLSMGASDRSKSGDSDSYSSSKSPSQPLRNKASTGNVILAVKPIPPRPPQLRPISPPLSPADDNQRSYAHNGRGRTQSSAAAQPPRSIPEPMPPAATRSISEFKPTSTPLPNSIPRNNRASPPPFDNTTPSAPNRSERANGIKAASSVAPTVVTAVPTTRATSSPHASPVVTPVVRRVTPKAAPPAAIQTRPTPSPVPVEPAAAPPPAHMSVDDARRLRRMFAKATSADECRLIFDMFLAKSSMLGEVQINYDAPYPSPSPSLSAAEQAAPAAPSAAETTLENSLLELLLNGDSVRTSTRKKKVKQFSESAPTSPIKSVTPDTDASAAEPAPKAVDAIQSPRQRPVVGNRALLAEGNGVQDTTSMGPRSSRRAGVIESLDLEEPVRTRSATREILV